MIELFTSHPVLLAMIVMLLLRAWTLPPVRDGVFAYIPKLPRPLQWLAPLALSMAADYGQGWLAGIRGEDLFSYAAYEGGQVGVIAVGLWHIYKRFPVMNRNLFIPVVAIGLFVIGVAGCASLPWSRTAYEQWRAACAKDLGARTDVATEATARGIDVGDFAEALCELSDVVAPFVRSNRASTQPAVPPGDQAVAAARAMGAM